MKLKEEVWKLIESGEYSGFRANPEFNNGGKWVQVLEYTFCDYFNVKHAISMNSATSCLHTALLACGIKPFDEVIATPFSFSSSASCILMANAVPVFADVQDDTYNIDPNEIDNCVTDKTRAIIPVHLMGNPVDMGVIIRVAGQYSLRVIEDASQAIGATLKGKKVGTFGDCGIFSLNQWKPVQCGEGGLLLTNDDEIARKAKLIRNHGETQSDILGYNYRLTEIQALIALEQFERLEEILSQRIELVNFLSQRLSGVSGVISPEVIHGSRHIYYTYGLRVLRDRELLRSKLQEAGYYFGNSSYGEPLYLQSIYSRFGYKEGLCPVAERLWRKEILVTDIIKPPLTKRDMTKIIEIIKEVME